MHWHVTQKLDQLILDAAPRAIIDYDDLDTSLAGRIDIHGISLVPVGQQDAFNINRISIEGPDAFAYLLNSNSFTGEPGAPKFLNILIKDLNLDLTPSLVENIDEDYQFSLQQEGQDISAACGGEGNMSLGILQDMGLDKLSADGRLFYRYVEKEQVLRASIELEVRDIQSMSMELTLGNITPHALKYGAPGMPWLNELRLKLNTVPEFGSKVSDYCAGKAEMTVAEYQEHAAGMFLHNLEKNGIELGLGLESAVRSYYKDWGEIDIVLEPPTSLNLMTLVLKPPSNMEQALGLQVAVNNQLLTDLSFTLQESAKLFVSEPQTGKKATIRKPKYRMVWKSITPADLLQYQDRAVKLYVTDRPVREGVLKGLDGDRVLVEQHLDRGKFTAHVPRKSIYKAEARVRVRLDP